MGFKSLIPISLCHPPPQILDALKPDLALDHTLYIMALPFNSSGKVVSLLTYPMLQFFTCEMEYYYSILRDVVRICKITCTCPA